MTSSEPTKPEPKGRINKWILFAALLAFAIFMYVSIAYKIINYGP